MSEELGNFDSLELKEKGFTIGDKRYVVVEADANAAREFRNTTMIGTQMKGRKVTKLGTIADAPIKLVSCCLFEDDGSGRKRVPTSKLGTWPERIVKPIFEWIKEISDLEEDDDLVSLKEQREEINERIIELQAGENPAKNGPEDTLVISD